MPTITIRLSGESVTREQKDALVSKSTDMIREILHEHFETTGVLIEETGRASWRRGSDTVLHRFRSPKEYERCLNDRWQGRKT